MTDIEKWRNKKGLSQATLAERANISQGAVARVEGGNTPSLLTALLLADETGIKPVALLNSLDRELLENTRRARVLREGGK